MRLWGNNNLVHSLKKPLGRGGWLVFFESWIDLILWEGPRIPCAFSHRKAVINVVCCYNLNIYNCSLCDTRFIWKNMYFSSIGRWVLFAPLWFLDYSYSYSCVTYLTYCIGWSQSMLCFQISCIPHFSSVKAGVRTPNESKIKPTKLSIPCFVLRNFLFAVLVRNPSLSGSQNTPNVRLIGVWFKSKHAGILLPIKYWSGSCIV